MTKGINKQVIEIHDTGNEYFEKALLFVKPEYATLGEKSLREKFIKTFSSCSVPNSKKPKLVCALRTLAIMLLSAGAGAVITALIK